MSCLSFHGGCSPSIPGYTFTLLVCTTGLSDSEESFTVILGFNNGLSICLKTRKEGKWLRINTKQSLKNLRKNSVVSIQLKQGDHEIALNVKMYITLDMPVH